MENADKAIKNSTATENDAENVNISEDANITDENTTTDKSTSENSNKTAGSDVTEAGSEVDAGPDSNANSGTSATLEGLGLTPESTMGDRVRALRSYLGMGLTELSRKTGLTTRSISYYESNERVPSVDAIKKLSAAMCVPISFFIDDEAFEQQQKNEDFLATVKESYGSRGVAQAKRVLNDTNALFAGGELSEDEQSDFIDEMQELFVIAKKRSKEKYTPKKYRHDENS